MIKTLLLADDDDEDVDIFKTAVADITTGIKILVVNNGALVLDLLKTSTELPDIIFLDLNMPVKNGLQCLKEIKASKQWKDIKIIILSTSTYPAQIKVAYDLGADLFITKPNSYTSFKNNLQKCLELRLDSLK